ncbi:hypothetical protein M2124_000991 [Polynucleobacter sphagniphilus]|uniref:hypothetical protein n=1 Tax=Polynucleobacter sphagniphilus TaxID=1743169 RepID=UPI002476304F|nr:hypothetical protein [Polynucleobacter sphagniphilus]MDH6154719.1 hypothetical protein [Polynucleobacter sphagniphilus]
MALVTTGDPDESGQLAQRQIEGVYTLDEAVNTLCQNVEVLDREQKLADLKALVENGEVQVNRPGTLDLTPIPLQARTFYEVAHWDNLNNNWLSKYQFIDWRFPDPLERLKPDWSYWDCDHLSLQDAICLSTNITPDWAKYIKDIGRRNVLKINDKLQRLPNALSWAQSPDCLWRYDDPSEFKASNQVKLSEFARWVVKEKPDWVIPSEFRALAKSIEVSPIVSVTKSKLPWGLKPLSEIQRMPNYRAVLYQTLKKMYEEGKETAPTAYEVLESWRSEFKNEQPKECKIWVLRTTFEFENKEGKRSTVEVKSLKEAIQRLLITE